MENRAAVFTSQPQAVEVYQAGAWWAGELLGWRHDADGSCQVRVRVVLGGVEETAWTELASLRLPERRPAVADTTPARSSHAPATQEMSVARHPSGRRSRPANDAAATAGPPMVGDLSVVPDLPATGGRRTADGTARFASVGRRRAPEAADVPAGGRRTADETAEFASVGRRRAPEDDLAAPAPAVPAPVAAPGRHRAPVDPGRHRIADAGLVPIVSDVAVATASRPPAARPAAGGAPASPRVSTPRPHGPLPRSGGSWTAPEGLDPELLTRPMRLSDHVPHARRPRVDGALRGV